MSVLELAAVSGAAGKERVGRVGEGRGHVVSQSALEVHGFLGSEFGEDVRG